MPHDSHPRAPRGITVDWSAMAAAEKRRPIFEINRRCRILGAAALLSCVAPIALMWGCQEGEPAIAPSAPTSARSAMPSTPDIASTRIVAPPVPVAAPPAMPVAPPAAASRDTAQPPVPVTAPPALHAAPPAAGNSAGTQTPAAPPAAASRDTAQLPVPVTAPPALHAAPPAAGNDAPPLSAVQRDFVVFETVQLGQMRIISAWRFSRSDDATPTNAWCGVRLPRDQASYLNASVQIGAQTGYGAPSILAWHPVRMAPLSRQQYDLAVQACRWPIAH